MSVKKNFIYNIIYQILIMILPLITAPYITRTLGDESLGMFSYTYSVASYFALFAVLGLNNYGSRKIAQIREDNDNLSKCFWEIFSMQFSLGVLVCFVYVVYILNSNSDNRLIALLQLGYVVAGAFDINWLFFGLEKFKVTVTRNIIIKLCSVILIFLLVKNEQDIYIYTIIMMGASLLSQIVLWPFVRKEVFWRKPKISEVIKHIKPNLILFIPVIAVSIYKVMDKIMLGSMSTMKEVAYYEYGEKIIVISVSLITALGTVMLPQITNLISKGDLQKSLEYIKKSMTFSIMSSSAIAFGIMSIADDFAKWFYGREFAASGEVMKYLAVTVIFISCANVIRTQFLIPSGKDKTYIISVILGALCNVGVNYILIPDFGAMGAVVGTILAEFIVMVYQFLLTNKEIGKVIDWREAVFFILLGICMYACVSWIDTVLITTNTFYKLLCEIMFGVFVYVGGAWWYLKKFNVSVYKSIVSVIPLKRTRR